MKEQAYNIIKTKDSRTQRQNNLNKSKEARFKILPQESKDHTLGEIVSLKYVYEHGSLESIGYLLKETSLQGRLLKTLKGNFGVMYDMVLGSSTSGFGWDPDKCVVTAPNDVWDAYAKCEIDLMKRVQKEIDALLGITFEEAFKVTDVIGVENHPPMLERSQYDSWQSRMLLYIRGKEHGIQLLESVKNGPFQFGTVKVPPTPNTPASTREQNLTDLIPEEKIHEVCDISATNIILQGLPPDVYTLVNHHTIAKEIWDRVKLLIEGSKLLLQERELKLYNEFDRFTFEKGETIHSYYLRFAKLINEMNTIGMTMQKL
ncbi:hypothetical protein Tco_1549235 [Tanacetum coccineum]